MVFEQFKRDVAASCSKNMFSIVQENDQQLQLTHLLMNQLVHALNVLRALIIVGAAPSHWPLVKTEFYRAV